MKRDRGIYRRAVGKRRKEQKRENCWRKRLLGYEYVAIVWNCVKTELEFFIELRKKDESRHLWMPVHHLVVCGHVTRDGTPQFSPPFYYITVCTPGLYTKDVQVFR